MVLVFGFLSGIALVAPIGPVSIAIMGIGTERGRRAALAGAGGVVTADILMLPIAAGAAGALADLGDGPLRIVEVVLGVTLLAMAWIGIFRTESARATVARIRRPAPTLLIVGLCNPMALASWAGLVLALPDSILLDGGLPLFISGVLLASAIWHAALALLAGTFGGRFGDRGRCRLIRASSVLLAGIAVVLLVG